MGPSFAWKPNQNMGLWVHEVLIQISLAWYIVFVLFCFKSKEWSGGEEQDDRSCGSGVTTLQSKVNIYDTSFVIYFKDFKSFEKTTFEEFEEICK